MDRVNPLKYLVLAHGRSLSAAYRFFEFLGGAVNLMSQSARTLFKRPFYFQLFFDQCYLIGVKSLSIVFVSAISTGMVMSLQFGLGLERFGGKLYVPKVVGLSIFRELGPVLSCLMIAGRVGSGIAAEIGSMKVTDQIDAIRALGTDPIKKIVIPRMAALLCMVPILVVLADIVGITGGMVLSSYELNIPPEFYFHEAVTALRMSDFTLGVVKAFVFAFIIGMTACYYGMNTVGGTQGVGQSTTHSVVTASILITIFDFILTKAFWIFERG